MNKIIDVTNHGNATYDIVKKWPQRITTKLYSPVTIALGRNLQEMSQGCRYRTYLIQSQFKPGLFTVQVSENNQNPYFCWLKTLDWDIKGEKLANEL